MSRRNKPLSVHRTNRNITETRPWSSGNQRNNKFPADGRPHPWKKDANSNPVPIIHGCLGFDELSLYYCKTPNSGGNQICALHVPASWLKSDSLFSFVDNNSHAIAARKILGILFQCVNLTTVGPRSTSSMNDSGPIQLTGQSSTTYGMAVYLETVRNSTRSVVGYRYVFVSDEDVSIADMVVACIADNRKRKNAPGKRASDWKEECRRNPHWSILNMSDFAKNLAWAVTNESLIQEDILRAGRTLRDHIIMQSCAINPIQTLTMRRAVETAFANTSSTSAGMHICAEQGTYSNYTTTSDTKLKFPKPEDVIRIPFDLCNTFALSRYLPPNHRPDPMQEMANEIIRNGPLPISNVFDRLSYMNSGRLLPPAAPLPDDNIHLVDSDVHLPHTDTVPGSEEYSKRLVILALEEDNRGPFYDLLDVRNSSTLTEDEYVGYVEQYHQGSFSKFLREIRTDNPMMTDAERGALQELETHIEICKATPRPGGEFGIPIFNDDVKFVPFTKDTDHSLDFEAIFFQQTFKYFEDLGATHGHAELVLMLCVAFQACSYNLDQDNIILLKFGGAGTSKSWGLDLFADKLLIQRTVSKYSHTTDMVGQTAGDTVGMIIIIHEFSRKQMGIDDRNPNSTGATHHKTQNDPRIAVLAFHSDKETGARSTISIKAFKRSSTFGATNDRQGDIPKPMLTRIIPCNTVPDKRYAASPQENCESRNKQAERKEQGIAKRTKILQALFYLTMWLVHSKTLFLPHGINRLAAQAVIDQFKHKMETNGFDIHSPTYIRSLNRVYVIAESLCVMNAISSVQHIMGGEMEFDIKTFAFHIADFLVITEMQTRWALNLCMHEFVDPIEYPIMQAIASVTNYSKNPGRRNGQVIHHDPPGHEPLVDERARAASSSSSRPPPVRATMRVDPVKYQKTANGCDFNFICVPYDWSKFQGMVRDEVENISGRELSHEQVQFVFKKMLKSTHESVNRTDHRENEEGREPSRRPAMHNVRGKGIMINADYLDYSLKNPIRCVDDAINDLNYEGQTPKSTVLCQPITGCSWILPRKEVYTCDGGYVMQTKNTLFDLNPDHSNRSPHAIKLSQFDRMIFRFPGNVDDIVMLHHLVSIGHTLRSEEDYYPFRIMRKTKRWMDARAQQLFEEENSVCYNNERLALVQARQDAQRDDFDEFFPQQHPIPFIRKDFKKQAVNLISRYRDQVDPGTVKNVDKMYKAALTVSGHPEAALYMDENVFQLGRIEYEKAASATGMSFIENHKRGRVEEDDLLMSIMHRPRKFHKPTALPAIPTHAALPEPETMSMGTIETTSSFIEEYA